MLYELYEYAVKNNLAVRPGFKPQKIKAYVCLGIHGELLGIDPGPKEQVICPDLGSMVQGGGKCNVLVEKRGITLDEPDPAKENDTTGPKHEFYLSAVSEAGEADSRIGVLSEVLQDDEAVQWMREKLNDAKIGIKDKIGFKVDGVPLETMVDDWWPGFLERQSAGKKKKSGKRCLITGEIGTPLETVPKISGLRPVGGHSSGDAVICFDKDAFCSYGFKKAENACVSELGAAAVNAALTELIGRAKIIAGAKWVHWYKEPLESDEEDLLADLFGVSLEEDEPESEVEDRAADLAADRLLESHRTGEKAPSLRDNIYYILPLSGAGGRIMVRGWQQGSYQDLQRAMDTWWEDLELCVPTGTGNLRYPPLKEINRRLLRSQKEGKKPLSERTKEELAGLEPQLIFAILNGTVLPDAVAAKALRYIRSKLLDRDEDNRSKEPIPDPMCCQLLKAWLIRKDRFYQRGGRMMQEKLDQEYPSTAYQCGRLMAVYAAIQSRAMGKKLGAGVIQRYYTSASTTPGLVFGRLNQLCQHHLSKIESRGAVIYYENLLSEISEKIGMKFPTTLDLRQQAEFSLGYYQQRADMYRKNMDNKD